MTQLLLLIPLFILTALLCSTEALSPAPIDYGISLKPEPLRKDVRVAASFIVSENSRVPMETAIQIVRKTNKAAKKYGVPKDVVLGLMHTESTFRVKAKSDKTALGLLQVHAATWLKPHWNKADLPAQGIAYTKEDLYDIDTNIEAGVYILSHYYSEAKRRNERNPMKYALTRYYGGKVNGHYERTMRSLSKYNKFKEEFYGTDGNS